MARLPKRLTTWLLLAAYLCASTVGGLLHSHEHRLADIHSATHAASVCSLTPPSPRGKGGSRHAHRHHEHQHAKHSHRHSGHKHADHIACSDSAEDSTKSSHLPKHQHHDDCAVCRFLGQVSLPVQVAPANMPLGLSVEAPAAFLATPSYGVPRATLHLRAGPAAA